MVLVLASIVSYWGYYLSNFNEFSWDAASGLAWLGIFLTLAAAVSPYILSDTLK